MQYLHQLWRLCSSSRRHSVRFMKLAVIGSVGVVINLVTMALLLKLTKIHNWRASAIASLSANLPELFPIYSLGILGTLSRRIPKAGWILLSYLLMSAAGMVVTTASYAGLAWGVMHALGMINVSVTSDFSIRMSCQFIALVLGVRFNYALNRMFDWPDLARLNLEAPLRNSVLR